MRKSVLFLIAVALLIISACNRGPKVKYVLEMSTPDVVCAMANNTNDTLFNQAINEAKEQWKTNPNSDFLSLFEESMARLDPEVRLAPYFEARLSDRIKNNYENASVINVLRSEIDEGIDYTCQVLETRINTFGVSARNIHIQRQGKSDRIILEVSGVKDTARMRNLLQTTAELQFWLVAKVKDAFHYLEDVNKFIATTNASIEKTPDSSMDELLVNSTDSSYIQQTEYNKNNPLFAKLYPNINPQTGEFEDACVLAYASPDDIADINEMFYKACQKYIIPSKIKFLWSAKPSIYNDMFELYAVQVSNRDGSPLLDGSVINDARQTFNNFSGNEIFMTMNSEGSREWQRITANNVGEFVAIVIDNKVFVAPRVMGEITGGRSSISGDFTTEEAKDLANLIKSGKLPIPVKIVEETIMEP